VIQGGMTSSGPDVPPSYGPYMTANEGVTGVDSRVTAGSGLCTHEPHFAGSETNKVRSGAAEADPAGSTRRRRLTCPLRTFWCLARSSSAGIITKRSSRDEYQQLW